jgi:hypothetical protein
VTLGDAVSIKSPMKMIYRKFPKTASLPVTCHLLRTYGISLSEWDGEEDQIVLRDSSLITGLVGHRNLNPPGSRHLPHTATFDLLHER